MRAIASASLPLVKVPLSIGKTSNAGIIPKAIGPAIMRRIYRHLHSSAGNVQIIHTHFLRLQMVGELEPIFEKRLEHGLHLAVRNARRRFREDVELILIEPRGTDDPRLRHAISGCQKLPQIDADRCECAVLETGERAAQPAWRAGLHRCDFERELRCVGRAAFRDRQTERKHQSPTARNHKESVLLTLVVPASCHSVGSHARSPRRRPVSRSPAGCRRRH